MFLQQNVLNAYGKGSNHEGLWQDFVHHRDLPVIKTQQKSALISWQKANLCVVYFHAEPIVMRLSHRVWRFASRLLSVGILEVSVEILMRQSRILELLNPDPVVSHPNQANLVLFFTIQTSREIA